MKKFQREVNPVYVKDLCYCGMDHSLGEPNSQHGLIHITFKQQ